MHHPSETTPRHILQGGGDGETQGQDHQGEGHVDLGEVAQWGGRADEAQGDGQNGRGNGLSEGRQPKVGGYRDLIFGSGVGGDDHWGREAGSEDAGAGAGRGPALVLGSDVAVEMQRISAGMDLTREGVAMARSALLSLAQELERNYVQRRAMLAGKEFSNLNFAVRHRGGSSIQLYWYLTHYRNGRRTGSTMLPKPRSARHYDQSAVRRAAADWLLEEAVSTEMAARPIREALAQLIELDKAIRTFGRLAGEIGHQGKREGEPASAGFLIF